MVVDDDSISLAVLQAFLSALNFNVITATDGEEALKVFAQKRADLILMDADMPRMDGFTACSLILKSVHPHTVPILIVTGLHDSETIDKTFAAGAVDYIPKPVNFAVLRNRVRYLVEMNQVRIALYRSEARKMAIFNTSLDCIIAADHAGKVIDFNPAAEKTFGYSNAEAMGKPMADLIIPPHIRGHHDRIFSSFMKGSTESEVLGRCLESVAMRKDGSEFLAEMTIAAQKVEGEWIFIGTIRDITERVKSTENLRQAASVFTNTNEGIIISDKSNRIVAVNPSFTRITGYAASDVVGQDPSILNSGRHDKTFFSNMWAQLQRDGKWHGEIWNRRKDGKIFPEWLSINVVHNDAGEIIEYVSMFADISIHKQYQEVMWRQTNIDSLTDLPSRMYFEDKLTRSINRVRRSEKKIAVVFIGIDRFKEVNKTLGHSAGDLILKQIAKRLRADVRDADILARFGGDVFVLMVETDHANKAESSIQETVQRILRNLSLPYQIQEEIITYLSGSIGIALYPDDGDAAPVLLQCAEIAMFLAKEAGRNLFAFFTHKLHENALKRMNLEYELRQAITQHHLILNYQPVVDLASERVVGAEALIRWRHPKKGIVPPLDFIPLAEETGLIVPIGEWVLRKVADQSCKWRLAGWSDLHIAFNVSARQLGSGRDFFDLTKQVMDQYQIPVGVLHMEITESLFMDRSEHLLNVVEDIAKLGLELSLDDFGTGYSSLSYLKRFKVDTLKIDRSFVRDICTDESDFSLIKAIVSIGHNFNLKIIAEGIETQEQLAFLRDAGCEMGQGYYFSKPLSESDFETYIHMQNNKSIN